MPVDIKTKDRLALKAFFRKNQIPTEGNFADLLDAMLNQKDDGIAKPAGDPLSIAAAGDANTPQRLINFYGGFSDPGPAWTLQMNPFADSNLPASARAGFSISDGQGRSRLFIDQASGNIGIGTLQPATPLHIVTKTGAEGAGYGNPMLFGQHIEFGATGLWGLKNGYGILHTWDGDSLFVGLKDEGPNRKDAIIAFGDDANDNLRILFAANGSNPPTECLKVSGAGGVSVNGAFIPSSGNSEANGVLFPKNPGGGTGDAAWLRYYPRSGEACTLELGTANDPDDHIALMPSGGVGIGTNSPGAKLDILATTSTWGGWFEAIRLSQAAHSAITHPGGGLLFGMHSDRRFYFADTVEGNYIMTIDANPAGGGNVGIGTTVPAFKLDVADRIRLRQGPNGATAGLWLFQSTPNSDRAFIGMAGDNEVGFWGNSGAGWASTVDTTTGTTKLLASSNPLYFTRTWSGLPDGVTNVSEISNDTAAHKTLMIIGNKSAGLGRRVSVWDRFEVNGTFVNNSSIEHKQDVEALTEPDYQALHAKLLATPLYRYRFKSPGIDAKVRLGVISEQSPGEILDETGKFVSFLDYAGFLFAALKAQAQEIERLAARVAAVSP